VLCEGLVLIERPLPAMARNRPNGLFGSGPAGPVYNQVGWDCDSPLLVPIFRKRTYRTECERTYRADSGVERKAINLNDFGGQTDKTHYFVVTTAFQIGQSVMLWTEPYRVRHNSAGSEQGLQVLLSTQPT
jgi:hypothetical protein